MGRRTHQVRRRRIGKKGVRIMVMPLDNHRAAKSPTYFCVMTRADQDTGTRMADSDLQGYHQRLIINDPRAVTAATGPRRPGFGTRFAIGLFMIPLGIAARVMAQIYTEITVQAVHYQSVFVFVAITHLLLIAATVLAVTGVRRRPLMGVFALQMWIGYGIGAALLALKDMG